jgi:hypothetical protein
MVAAITVMVATPAVAAAGFAPGKWQHRTHLVKADIPGIPGWVIRLVASNTARTSCHGADELSARPEALLTASEDAVCRLRAFSMAGGKLVFDTFCTNRRFPEGLLVSSRGTYTANSYAIATSCTGMRNGRAVHIETTGSGRLVGGSCRAG